MTQQAKGLAFGPKHLEQSIPSYLPFIEQAKPSQAKPTIPEFSW